MLNQLKNCFNQIFKNIISHLFVGESYLVVKITVTYPTAGYSLTSDNLGEALQEVVLLQGLNKKRGEHLALLFMADE